MMLRGLFFASFISVMLAMLVSFLPTTDLRNLDIESARNAEQQTVFQPIKPFALNVDLLVSFLKQVPIHYHYKKVNVEHNDLFIDIQVTKQEMVEERIFEDAYELIKATFGQTKNINQMFIKFIVVEDAQETLLLAVTCNRRESIIKEINAEATPQSIELFLKTHTKLVYGTGWRKP